jgi:hypothetical protein
VPGIRTNEMKTKRVTKKNATKAYKAFNSDLTCKDFQYEVGKEYHHKGKLELCESGFHACPKLTDCFYFYPFNKTKTRVAEVLVWGKVEYEDIGNKLCASNIKVVRELAWSEVLLMCNSGNYNTGYGNSGNWNSGNWNSGNNNTGHSNSGNRNSSNYNTGDYNTGDCNSGSRNSDNYNIGNYNTGYGNSGNHNSGDYNTGDYNTGDCNSGDWNSGDWNSGNGNSGYWNSGDNNSGYLNTSTQEYCFIFNKPVEKSVLSITKFPAFMRFTLTEWIPDSKMSQQEKNQHPEYATIGGYLKKYTYKEAFRKSFEEAKRLPDWPEQLKSLKALPNFDAKIFEEISGITTEELGVSDEDLAAKSTVTIEVTMADLEQKYGCKVRIVKDR